MSVLEILRSGMPGLIRQDGFYEPRASRRALGTGPDLVRLFVLKSIVNRSNVFLFLMSFSNAFQVELKAKMEPKIEPRSSPRAFQDALGARLPAQAVFRGLFERFWKPPEAEKSCSRHSAGSIFAKITDRGRRPKIEPKSLPKSSPKAFRESSRGLQNACQKRLRL